jgi:hypothetical protein
MKNGGHPQFPRQRAIPLDFPVTIKDREKIKTPLKPSGEKSPESLF